MYPGVPSALNLKHMNRHDDVATAYDRLISSDKPGTLLVAGLPCSGKTQFAYTSLLRGMRRFGSAHAMMTVSGRTAADELSNRVIRAVGASSQVRPVSTLSALAFRVIADSCATAGNPAPHLLNGAEQDALLRRVVGVHLQHAESGDMCSTCMLLRNYFASDNWAETVNSESGMSAGNEQTALALFSRGVSSAFIDQLRDMLARINELGASFSQEESLIAMLHQSEQQTERTEVQWRLVFALRREYVAAINDSYPGEYRLDSSRLLVEAELVIARGHQDLPAVLIVDDFQDTTLAGLRFLEALGTAGVRLLLVGNPDEAVQTFRGSYPEHLFSRAQHGVLHADMVQLDESWGTWSEAEEHHVAHSDHSYRDVVTARVSLSIPSPEDDDIPLVKRPWKVSPCEGALPIKALPENSPLLNDGSVQTAIYHSAREELDDVVWRIKRAHLDAHIDWNDMAVIAHDNATVRTFGERLRRDGVPVRYSSVNRPLKEEPFVQGLFALTELADLRRQGINGTSMSLAVTAAYVRTRVRSLMESSLVTTGLRSGEGGLARWEPIESAMATLASLSGIMEAPQNSNSRGESHSEKESTSVNVAPMTTDREPPRNDTSHIAASGQTGNVSSRLEQLIDSWEQLRHSVKLARKLSVNVNGEENSFTAKSDAGIPHVNVDDHLVDSQAAIGDNLPFNTDALLIMLAFDNPLAPASDVLAAIVAVLGSNSQARAFTRLWELVNTVSRKLEHLETTEPHYVLSQVWEATGVAQTWQKEALRNTPEGRAANDRLDAAMRLFQFAEESAGSGRDIVSFITQMRSMQIEADSLAHIGPIEHAVTLTTPAGAAGHHWEYVWLPAVQQDIWPNLAERSTLFGGEDLADIMLRGTLPQNDSPSSHDRRLVSVLSSEKKSLLVALTRAQKVVSISATWNDDVLPSDFLYGYLPEHYSRDHAFSGRITSSKLNGLNGTEETNSTEALPERNNDNTGYAGLDADPRGLVTAARIVLARYGTQTPQGRDAAASLALLAQHGVACANPNNWAFPGKNTETATTGESKAENTTGSSTVNSHQSSAVVVDHQHKSGQTSPTNSELITLHTSSSADNTTPVVSLSSSAVDRIWECPVCWMLENRLAGPQAGSASTSFGTVIHKVAQIGSEEGLDRTDFMPDATETARIDAATQRLHRIYEEIKTDWASFTNPQQQYAAMQKDTDADTVLGNIASYFVQSRDGSDIYLARNAKNTHIGTLEQVECEREFNARFDLNDVLRAYCAIPEVKPIRREELSAIMGYLVGGWPEGMHSDLVIRLSGRIDRMEHRRQKDGSETIRLIDYKTGGKFSTLQMSNDLQLVCYQLGLAFSETKQSDESLSAMPCITQSDLFFVKNHSAPAYSYAPEGAFQPPLFVNNSLNATSFTARSHYTKMTDILDIPDLPSTPPDGVSTSAWENLLSLRGTQAIWALTMIARVFYAGAAKNSHTLTAHPTETHIKHCRMRDVCPACAGQIDTVYETRQA